VKNEFGANKKGALMVKLGMVAFRERNNPLWVLDKIE